MRKAPRLGSFAARATVSNGVTRWHGVCVSMDHVHSLPDTTMPTLAAFRRALYTLLSARFIELQKQQRRS
jgi:hypothetical protein